MSKGTFPVVMCDADDACGTWDLDHYAMGVTSVDGVSCTPVPAGWTLTPDGDHLCPEHAQTQTEGATR